MATSSSVEAKRGAFSSRNVFILAAIGSAVGLGNIWRFPYVAYENGGGSFLIPYLVALLTVGIPFLLLDYAIGHKHRGSAPLSFARLSRGAEALGWWQVGICFMIAVYYAAVLAWAVRYTMFATDRAWGADPVGFFVGDFLNVSDHTVTTTIVPGVLWPLLVVWLVVGLVLMLGVQKGIGRTALFFMPILILAFLALVVQSLFLDGAFDGLQAFFQPNWSALGDHKVWAAAFGHIFFSLSIGFGIMITYASYVNRKTDMTGSGLVVGFSNSGFELLAGIGVFAALGFMAQAQGVAIDAVADDGVGLAFMAFPAIINEAPAGVLLGLLFFGSLVIAGITSLISVIEVVISAVRDKLGTSRATATLLVVIPAAVISVGLFSMTSGLWVLDIVDHFVLQFGILTVAIVTTVVVAWILRALPSLGDHLNRHGTPSTRGWWPLLIGLVAPVALLVVLGRAFYETVANPYGDYPGWMLALFGWTPVTMLMLAAFVIAITHFRKPPLPPVGDTDVTSPDDAEEAHR